MKTFISITTITLLTFTFVLISNNLFSQDYIKLKNRKTIREARLHEIKKNTVVYEKEGSLHDLYIPEIDYLVSKGERITFDRDNLPVFEKQTKHLDSVLAETYKQLGIVDSIQYRIAEPYSGIDDAKTKVLVRPLAAAEFYGNLYGVLNIPCNPNLNLKLGAGWIFHNYNRYREHLINGYKLGIEEKNIFSRVEKNNKIRKTYLALGLDFIQAKVSYDEYSYVYDNPYGYTNNYKIGTQLQINNVVKYNLKIGYENYYKNGLLMDFYLGIGYRTAFFDSNSEGEYPINEDIVFTTRPHVLLGFDIGF